MNKFIKKPFGKQSKKLSPQVVSKVENNPAKKKDGGFSKKGLETRIFAQTLRGVALLTVDEVKALQISLDSKGHGSLTIDDVLFTCEEVSIADQQKAYVFKRTIDHSSMQNAALISAEQASKIGLKEGIDQIRVGDTYYKVHYVDYADFPKKFKQDNQIVNPHLAPLSSQDEKNENSAAELSQFFQNLREKERKLTPTKEEETTPSDDQTITVSNLKQSLIPQGIKDKKIYDLTNLQDKEDLSKKVVDQSLDTDLQRETELALARTTLTSQGDFEVDFAYKHS